jgi:hypothetical protein
VINGSAGGKVGQLDLVGRRDPEHRGEGGAVAVDGVGLDQTGRRHGQAREVSVRVRDATSGPAANPPPATRRRHRTRQATTTSSPEACPGRGARPRPTPHRPRPTRHRRLSRSEPAGPTSADRDPPTGNAPAIAPTQLIAVGSGPAISGASHTPAVHSIASIPASSDETESPTRYRPSRVRAAAVYGGCAGWQQCSPRSTSGPRHHQALTCVTPCVDQLWGTVVGHRPNRCAPAAGRPSRLPP